MGLSKSPVPRVTIAITRRSPGDDINKLGRVALIPTLLLSNPSLATNVLSHFYLIPASLVHGPCSIYQETLEVCPKYRVLPLILSSCSSVLLPPLEEKRRQEAPESLSNIETSSASK